MELHQAVFRALAAVPDPDAGTGTPPLLIRQAYANPSPPPPEEGRNVLYYHLEPDAGAPVTEEFLSPDGNPVRFRFAPWILVLVFYGPRAERLAWRYFHLLFLDGAGKPRRILRAEGIYPLPRPSGPALVWEEWGKQHQPRADLVLPLRIAERETVRLPEPETVEVPPEVRVHVSGRA